MEQTRDSWLLEVASLYVALVYWVVPPAHAGGGYEARRAGGVLVCAGARARAGGQAGHRRERWQRVHTHL